MQTLRQNTIMLIRFNRTTECFEKEECLIELLHFVGQRFFLKNDFINEAHSSSKISNVTVVFGCNRFGEIVE